MIWDDESKRETLKKYGITLLNSACTIDDAENINLPTNSHLVIFKVDEVSYCDIVQSFNKSVVFDAYYDKLGKGSIVAIKNTRGSISPRIYGAKAPKERKRNS